MRLKSVWNDGRLFKTLSRGHIISMDSPGESKYTRALSPPEILAGALACSAGMEILQELEDAKQHVEHFEIETEGESAIGRNDQYQMITLTYRLYGDVAEQIALQIARYIHLKKTAIAAMLSESIKVNWRLYINDLEAGAGDVLSFLSHE